MMDIVNILKKVNNINEYVAVTENSSAKCKISKIELNMSNVLALTKIRSLEIEHINKCEQNGIGCLIFERMLCLPPSKTWEVLSKELVNILQYWLDAVRKHLIKHSTYWWTFLKLLLKFTKEIHKKGTSVPNILVEHITECLLDLATNERPDAMQRYEILHCFNLFCCESSREVRLAMRRKFEQYFTKLSVYMCDCGHLPTQYSILETLLRWLVPRQDRTLRVTSATKWFPTKMYSDNTVDIFLERSWMDFYQDARDFLNTHNGSNDIITSVVCTKLSVGDFVIISDKQYKDSWLDVNINTKCLSVLLNPRVLDAFGGTTSYKSFETLIVSNDNIHNARFSRENEQLVLSIRTLTTPCIVPSHVKLGDDEICDVTVVITPHCDHKRLDAALRKILEDRYQLLIDLEELAVPPVNVPEPSSINVSEVPSSLSHVKGRLSQQRSGVKYLNPVTIKSPSSASTTSLAQLHEKLAELPRLRFVREPKFVSANPKLSAVTEVSETDDKSISTFKRNRFGSYRHSLNSKRGWQSDNESFRGNSELNKTFKPFNDQDATSSLLVATIGSADESVILRKKESISKSPFFNGDNIIDLLMQEASSAQLEKERDAGINIDQNKPQIEVENCDAIDKTLNIEVDKNIATSFKKQTIFNVISSTSDESNTEIINDTPNVYLLDTRRNPKDLPKSSISKKTLDDKIDEQYFSQHVAETGNGEIIHTTLARKLNETSSENSAGLLDDNLILMGDDLHDMELVDFEVLECLNSIVEEVCNDLDKCTKFMDSVFIPVANSESDYEDNIPLQDIMNLNSDYKNKLIIPKKNTQKNIKLKYRIAPKKGKQNSRGTKEKHKSETGIKPKMSTILEDNAEVIGDTALIPEQSDQNVMTSNKNLDPKNITKATTPVLRKKRKLFSPKDEDTDKIVPMHLQSREIDSKESEINKTPLSSSIYKPYKGTEMKSQLQIRFLRNRKARSIETTSPRSKKLNELFDKVKNSTNSEQVILAKKPNKFEIYNFSTDSDDDFKIEKATVAKKTVVSKKNRAPTNDNQDVALRRNKTEKRVNSSGKGRGSTKRKVKTKQRMKTKVNVEVEHELVDERMRNATNVLNSSFMMEQAPTAVTEPEPVIQHAAEIEVITENNSNLNECQQKKKAIKRNKIKNVVAKVKSTINKKSDVDDDRTVSPLPGLVVEEVAIKDKEDDLPAKTVEKLKKICQNTEKYINESNTTQNLLSDIERTIYSPHNINVTDVEACAKLDDKVQSKSKPKPIKVKKHEIGSEKVRNISKDKDVLRSKDISRSKSKSDQSIATVSITGHGDSDEVPPGSELIAQKLEHRNLDTDYLNDSMKDYCNKLREEINGMIIDCNDSNKTSKSIITIKSDRQTDDILVKNVNSPISSKSPIVSIDRISLENIRRWLPSSRTSGSASHSDLSKKSKLNNAVEITPEEKVKSPNVVLSTHEQDSIRPDEIHDIKRPLRSFRKSPIKNQARNDFLETNVSIKSSNASVKKNIKKPRVQPPRSAKCTQRSVISPIKLFDDLTSNVDKMSETPLSEDEDFMAVIKETSRSILKKREQTQSSSEVNPDTEIKASEKIKKNVDKIPKSTVSSSESIRSKISSIQINNSSNLKRKLEEDLGSHKKKKIEKTVSGSALTVSSVDNWFKRNDTGDSRSSVRDSIVYVLEKLDTTLVGIQQKTSQKLGQLLVSTQQRWSELNDEKHRMYKTVACEILTSVVKIIDDKFKEMDKKSQEQDQNFLSHLKQQSLMFVKEDCLQKRVMVQLLKEDLEAVLEHDRRNKNPN